MNAKFLGAIVVAVLFGARYGAHIFPSWWGKQGPELKKGKR